MTNLTKLDFRPAREPIARLPKERRDRIKATAREMAQEMQLDETPGILSVPQTEPLERIETGATNRRGAE